MPWPVVPLAEIAEWGSGGTPRRSEGRYFGSGHPWLSIADLNDGQVASAKESLTPLGIQNSSAKVVPPGTVLIAMYGSIGKLGIAAVELCTSQAIAFAIPHADYVDTRYLFHFLLAERPRLIARGRGGTQMNIGQADLKAWLLPLPPMEEQRRIADILDRADALRAKRREALAHLDDLTQSIFVTMFGNIYNSADVVKLSEAVRPSTGSTPSRSELANFGGKVPWVKTAEVCGVTITTTDESLTELGRSAARCTIYPAGSILIALYGQGRTRGQVGILGIPAATNQACAVLAPNEQYDTWFMFEQLRLSYNRLRAQARGGNQANLNLKIISDFPVILPSIADQGLFAERARKIEYVREGMRAQLREATGLFASLQQRAFAGTL